MPDVLGRPLAVTEAEMFSKYLILLRKWQRSQRLVGSDDPAWIVEHLFLDSLLFLRVLPAGVRSVLDLGSGAGFPGIPIKIARRDLRVVLLESRRRRASFLAAVVRELGLTDVVITNARAEDMREELAASVDAVVMRRAGDFSSLSPLALELVAPGGVVIASGPPAAARSVSGKDSEEMVVVAGLRGGARTFLVRRRPLKSAP